MRRPITLQTSRCSWVILRDQQPATRCLSSSGLVVPINGSRSRVSIRARSLASSTCDLICDSLWEAQKGGVSHAFRDVPYSAQPNHGKHSGLCRRPPSNERSA